MASSGMLRRVTIVRTDVSEALSFSTWCNIPDDAILHSHCRENLKSYNFISVQTTGLSVTAPFSRENGC
jgi:carbonic anhydrase/acetyltransferase-like protein (isoleucine patch superfamily)